MARTSSSSFSGGTTRDTMPWRKSLVGGHHPPRQDQVRRDPVTADLEYPRHPAGVGDHAVPDFGQHEARSFGGHPDVAQERPLEGRTDRPALEGDDDRRIELEDGADPAVSPAHELVVGQAAVSATERTDVPP